MYKRTKLYDLSYYKFIGTWAWILHRLSGLALIFYLMVHIWIINTITRGEQAFDHLMGFMGSPVFKILEVGLWGVILFHAFNGVRVIIVDFFKGSLAHKKWFYVFITVTVLLWIAGSYLLLSHIHW